MITMLSPEYVKKAAERTERIKEAIAFGRDAGMGEDQITVSGNFRFGKEIPLG